jgi:hypothetical protein
MCRHALALAMFGIVACSAPRRTPRFEERIAAADSATLRSTRAGDVMILVDRSLGDAHASGDARVLGITIDAARASPHRRLAAARAWLAVSQLANVDAYAAAKRGIEELGRDYAPKYFIDDTSRAIHRAEDYLEHDRAGAAGELQSVLRERIYMYARKYADQVE